MSKIKKSDYSIMNESNAAVAEAGGLSVNQALHCFENTRDNVRTRV